MEIKVGFLGLLTIVFIVLKLTGVIAWSWLWVVAPLWAPVAIIVGLLLIALAGVIVFFIFALLAAIILVPIMGKQWVKDNLIKIKMRLS